MKDSTSPLPVPPTPSEIEDAKRELEAAADARDKTERAATIAIFLDGECVHERRSHAAIKKAFHLSHWAVVVVSPKLDSERYDNIVSVRTIDEGQVLARSVACVNCADEAIVSKALLMGVPQIMLVREESADGDENADDEAAVAAPNEHADKVVELGAGVTLPVGKEIEPDSLRALVESVLNDESYAKAAQKVSKQLLSPKAKKRKKKS